MRSYIGLRIMMGDSCSSLAEAMNVITKSVGCDPDEVDLFELEELSGTDSDVLQLDNGLCCVIPVDSSTCTVEGLTKNLATTKLGSPDNTTTSSFIVSHLSPSLDEASPSMNQPEVDTQSENLRNAMLLLSLSERYNAKAEAMKIMADMVTSQLVNMQLHIESSVVSAKSMFKSFDVAKCFAKLEVEAPFSAVKRSDNQTKLAKLIEAECQEYANLMERLESCRQKLLPA